MEKDTIQAIITLIMFIVVITSFIIVGYIIYQELKTSYSCDIGNNQIAGDYFVIPDTFYNNRACAIEDCSAFNNYQKSIGGESLCLV